MDKRKLDHIQLTESAQISSDGINNEFDYEPLFGVHKTWSSKNISFLNKTLRVPLWISSMTGGTGSARHINQNLARVAGEFGIGMGLGSCRPLLESDQYFEDFNLRAILGEELPFFANLGVAQCEELIQKNEVHRINEIIERLKADGLIIHINPIQEWYQPEGDRFKRPAIETLEEIIPQIHSQIIVKEVGQGFGPKSLKALMNLPVSAIEFGAFGGTNFSKLESLRCENHLEKKGDDFIFVGHSAKQMIVEINKILEQDKSLAGKVDFIVSGGIRNALQGLSLTQSLNANSIFAMARPFLTYANEDYEKLKKFVQSTLDTLAMADEFLSHRQEEEHK